MAQESVLETDTGIIITNNVELSTNSLRNSLGNSNPNSDVVAVQTESNSLRRHNISISSIDSNASSSPAASDTETDDDTKIDCTGIENLTNEYLSNIPRQDGNLPIVEDSPGHNITHMEIKNSTNVRVGNTQEFHAPVTIQQFMVDETRKRWTEIRNGIENNGFVKNLNDPEDEHNSNNAGRTILFGYFP